MSTERQQWLERRRSGIGGSDIAAVMGLNRYCSRVELYMEKRGELAVGDEESDPAYWGRVLEDVVAHEYQKRKNLKVQRVNDMMRHPKHDFAIANIDRAVINPAIMGRVKWKDGRLTTDRILECKTANCFLASQWGDPDSDMIPDYYLTQGHWYMGITRADVCDVAVLIGGQDFRIMQIERDDDMFGLLLDAGAEFWARVREGRPPEPMSEDEARLLWASHKQGKSKEADEVLAAKIAELKEVKASLKALEEVEKALRDQIVPQIEDAEEITFNGDRLLTFKANKDSKSINWEALATPYLSRLTERNAIKRKAQFTNTKPGARVLRLSA